MATLSEEEVAEIFDKSSYLKFLIIFRIVTSAVAIVLLLIMEWNRNKLVAHNSLHMLLNTHGLWTFILCLSTLLNSVATGISHLTMKHPSDLLIPISHCFPRQIISTISIYGSIFSMFVMSIERRIASQNIATYEQSSRSTGIKLLVLQLALVMLCISPNMLLYGGPNRVAQCPTISPYERETQKIMSSFCFLLEIFTIVSYTRLLKRNEKLRTCMNDELSLSERFQLKENLRVIRLVLPIVWSHTSISMFGAAAFIVFQHLKIRDELYSIFEDTINIIYLQGIIMPTIFLLRHRKEQLTERNIIVSNRFSSADFISRYENEITKGW